MTRCIYILILGLIANSCATPKRIVNLCIISIEDEMCWEDKDKNQGKNLDDLNLWMAMPVEEMDRITEKLIECQTK